MLQGPFQVYLIHLQLIQVGFRHCSSNKRWLLLLMPLTCICPLKETFIKAVILVNIFLNQTASVRLCALSLVYDSPCDLREELSSSVHQAISAIECHSLSEEDMELVLRCTIFHSVLRQRQAFKCSVSGKLYNW